MSNQRDKKRPYHKPASENKVPNPNSNAIYMNFSTIKDKKQIGTVTISIDEYAELIEDKTLLDNLYRFITSCHVDAIKRTGKKSQMVDFDDIEAVCGYTENENYFYSLANEHKRKAANLNEQR